MVRFPNCKINIGLHITGRRADGYHNLETVFYPLPINDCLEIIAAGGKETSPVLTMSGLPVQGGINDNICIKAWHLLKLHYSQLPPVTIHLHKNIPMGAGLGGGSADGAFMLQMLGEKFNLQLSEQQLVQYALELGSDCPFFIINTPCYAEGRGELLQRVTLNLSSYYFVIINPGIHISTKWAFSQLKIQPHHYNLLEAIQQPVDSWKDIIINDFEKIVSEKYSSIAEIKAWMYSQGALYASMTGSGSTLFGIFTSMPLLPSFPADYTIKTIPPKQAAY